MLDDKTKEMYNNIYNELKNEGYKIGVRRGDVWGPSTYSNSLTIEDLAQGQYYVMVFYANELWKIGLFHSADVIGKSGIILHLKKDIDYYDFLYFLEEILESINGG